VSDDKLEIDTSKGDIYQGTATNPKNLLLQPAPDGNWTIETKVDASAFNEAYQQAGLMLYADDANYVKLDFLATNPPGSAVSRGIELRSEVANAIVDPAPNAPAPTQGVWYLRLAKNGSTFTGSYSADGLTWTALPAVTNTAVGSAKFGVYAFGVDQTASKTAKFDYFKLVKDTTAPQVNLSLNPGTPSGLDGWWNDAVIATALGTDDQPGQVYLERKIDDGDWAEYTAPITVSAEGTHTVQVRASDTAGNVSEVKSATVKLDRSAPQTTVTGLTSGGKLGVASVATVAATATDALSGVASVGLTVDGKALPADGKLDGVALGLGAHELAVTSTDKAGNTAVTKVPFTVIASYAEANKLVERYRVAKTLPLATATILKVQLALAEQQQKQGHRAVAIVAMNLYLVQVKTVRDGPARTLLTAVGQDLRARI
jgi:regulation of enolase protein 1 (concanavalin A-like superfamily)